MVPTGGNSPQALTRMALIDTVRLLSMAPEETRACGEGGRPVAVTGVA